MADGHGGVARQQQHGHGLADHQAAPNHGNLLTRGIDAVVVQHLHAGNRRGRGEGALAVGEHARERCRGNGIHILFRSEQGTGGIFIQMRRERTEHEATVNGGIFVHLADNGLQLLLACVLVEHEGTHVHAHRLRALGHAAFVAQVVGALAHAYDREHGGYACSLERIHALGQVFGHGIGNGLAQKKLTHRRDPPVLRRRNRWRRPLRRTCAPSCWQDRGSGQPSLCRPCKRR